MGYNILKESLLAQCGMAKSYNLKISKNTAGWFLVPPLKGKLVDIPEKLPFPNVLEYKLNAKLGDIFEDANRSVDHIASVILRGESEDDIVACLDNVAAWLTQHTKWNKDVIKV